MVSKTYITTLIVVGLIFSNAAAQDASETAASGASTGTPNTDVIKPDPVADKKAAKREEAVAQLRDIEVSLQQKVAQRKELRQEIESAEESRLESLQAELTELNSEIELLEKTFEQIAIGGIDLSVFGVEEENFNWREELVLIVKPLIENVKGLTEKPRKIESLRRVIDEKTAAMEKSEEALSSITKVKEEAVSDAVIAKLSNIEEDWRSRLQDIEREVQLATYQLESLEGKNVRWVDVIKQGFFGFLQGRGLTLLLLIVAATAVWLFMRTLLWLIRKRTSESPDRSSKTHYRLAAYGYRLLTVVLIAIAIMMVLYFRQDLLLLAIMVVLFIGAALALKNLLPKYIAESRLLLNMGGVREKERVIFNGLPWEVSNINMFSRFTNPEIRGAIRIPIGQMHEMISRPSIGDPWFPSSEGDWVIGSDDNPLKVIRQSVDMIELEDLDSVTHFMPSADYFTAGFPNLTRTDAFRITVVFGIDYATQKENVAEIENTFQAGIKKSFEGTPFNQYVLELNVDFHSAGDSSLNYLMLAKFKPEAAEFYNRIKRRIQRACVMVCNENNWGIPFPQRSVHLSVVDQDTDIEISRSEQDKLEGNKQQE